MELMHASRQWANRPADERYTSLLPLSAYLNSQKDRSVGRVVSSRTLGFSPDPNDDLKGLTMTSRASVGSGATGAAPTHWSFGQLSQLAGAPAGYLRTLPAPLVADALNYGFGYARDVEDVGLLVTQQDDGTVQLRAATGPRYGRIYNADLIDSLIGKFGDGVSGTWKVPGEFGKDVPITKANTTIFGSDRDVFVFLADEKNRIELPGRRAGKMGSFARGFFVWNSEVGSASIGAAFFLFDYTCCNRIVWGAQQFHEIRLRHTVSAPDRWLEEIAPMLQDYSEAAAAPVVQHIEAARAKKVDDLRTFLGNRFGKLSQKTINLIADAHKAEEDRPIETLWDVATAITAYAKTIPFQDERVSLERIGGKVLDLAA